MDNLPKEITREAIDFVFSQPGAIYKFVNTKRDKAICEMRLQGNTYEAIGKYYGLNKNRPREICVKVMQFYRRELRIRESQQPKKLTYYEKIKTFSIEEMAEMLTEVKAKAIEETCERCMGGNPKISNERKLKTKQEILELLESEVVANGRTQDVCKNNSFK